MALLKSSMMMILTLTSLLSTIVTARSPGLLPLPPSPSPASLTPIPSPVVVHSPTPTPSAIAHSPTPIEPSFPSESPSGLVISPAMSPSISNVPASAPVSQNDAALYQGSMGLVSLGVLAVAALVV